MTISHPQQSLEQLQALNNKAMEDLASMVANYQPQFIDLDIDNLDFQLTHLQKQLRTMTNLEEVSFDQQLIEISHRLKDNQNLLIANNWHPQNHAPSLSITVMQDLIAATIKERDQLLDSASTPYQITCKEIFLLKAKLKHYIWEKSLLSARQDNNTIDAATYLFKLQPDAQIAIMRAFKAILDVHPLDHLSSHICRVLIPFAIYYALDCVPESWHYFNVVIHPAAPNHLEATWLFFLDVGLTILKPRCNCKECLNS